MKENKMTEFYLLKDKRPDTFTEVLVKVDGHRIPLFSNNYWVILKYKNGVF